MYSEISANKRKTWLILAGFVGLVAILAYFISFYYSEGGSPGVVAAILLGSLVYASISYFSGMKMAVAMNGAKEIEMSDNPRLYRIVENLAITNGMPMPKVYVIDDPALNAFATGRDPDHAIVAATSGLIEAMSDSELEGVMAHEMGHVKNYDIRVSLMAFALVAVIALISDIVLRMMWYGGNRRSKNNNGGGAAVVLLIVVAILAPIVAQLLKFAISRQREYLADATGVQTTRYPEGLASALEKIGRQGSATKRQNTATSHLFFANPLKGNALTKLFSTHPPIEDRISRINDMGNQL